MENYKKTFWGSVVAFVIGTSCCWLTSLAVWLGGAAVLVSVVSYIENFQVLMISLGVIFLLAAIFMYYRKLGRSKNDNESRDN